MMLSGRRRREARTAGASAGMIRAKESSAWLSPLIGNAETRRDEAKQNQVRCVCRAPGVCRCVRGWNELDGQAPLAVIIRCGSPFRAPQAKRGAGVVQ